MNITYSVSEILKCVEIINQPNKKFERNSDKTFNLINTASMKKTITQTQGTFGETIETEELIEETFDDAEPFEIDEITKIEDSAITNNKNNKKKISKPIIRIKKKSKPLLLKAESKPLLLKAEVVNQSSRQNMNKKYIDVLEEELKIMTKITNENKDQLKKYKNFNLSLNEQVAKLNEQVSKLKEHNAQLENDFNKVSKESNQQTHDKDFRTKLDVIYKQQNIIKDYQDQISMLKEENQLLEKNTELPPGWMTGDLKFNHTPKNGTDKLSEDSSQQKYDDELKTKSKFIYEQQNIIQDYQDQISKLKEENQLLEQNSEKTIHQKDNKDEMEDITGKIKYYQDDNLRLSNELVKLSNKLENTKSQLEYFENNKARLISQVENLNNIISESNVVDNPFDTTISKKDDRSSTDEKISNNKQTAKNQFKKIITSRKIENSEEMNRLTKDIFKK